MDSKVSNVHIHGAKDSIQNEVNTEEASPSHVDSTAPLNAASPSALQTITQVGDKSLRIQGVEPSTQVNVVVGSAKDSSMASSNSPVMPLHSSAMAVSSPNWSANTSTGSKTNNMSNSNTQTHLTPQKENISDSKGNNLSTNTQTPSTSGSHDMLTPVVKATPPTNYTTETVNFPSPSTSIDSSPLGAYNQFSVNPEKTTPGQPTSPNNAAKAKPFVCTVCNQTFSRQHNLKSHALTHSQEKPFQCDICHHFFRRHHDLKRHAKLHTGEKPYQCQHCKRSFARLDALNRHLRAESFCGGPQKKLYQGTESKLEQQPPPLQLSPQQTTPQPQLLLSTQSQPQSKQVQSDITTKSQNQQSDPKTNTLTTPQQQIVQPQQFKQTREDAQNKQTTNSSTSPQAKTDISRQPQDFYKQRPMIHQEQYQWQIQNQQSAPIQTIPSPNNQSLQAKPVLSIANPTHHQIVFPVEASTSISTNSSASHYQMQYTHSQSEFNVQVQESQRRAAPAPEALMSNEQDIDGRILHNKASQREMQLIERNNYLEERVRELENEVINERKSRSRREFLESKVNELEIEKKLLKQLLLERDTNGNSEINQNHEKKRKATSPIEPSNSKHQKDGERIIIQQ